MSHLTSGSGASDKPPMERSDLSPPANDANPSRFPRHVYLLLILLTLALRLAGLGIRHEFSPPPQIGAEAGAIAQNILHGHGFTSPFDDPAAALHSPSVHLAPAYPYLLAALLKLGLTGPSLYYAALALNLLFASLLPAILLAIATTLRFPKFVSLLAALALCFCPEAFRAPALIWDEAIFVTLTALLILLMLKHLQKPAPPTPAASARFGLASGILALLNPAMALALPFAWLAALRARSIAWQQILLHAALFLALTFAASSPWHIRNWFLLDPPAPVFIRGGFWVTAWSAIHPLEKIPRPDGTFDFLPLHPWAGTDLMLRIDEGIARPLTELQFDAWCKQRVLAAVRQNPAGALRHVIHQFDSFWLGIAEARRWSKNPWPFFLAQGLPALAGILGLYLARRRIPPPALALLCALLLVYPLPYYLADASARYRHPLDPILYLGCAWLIWLLIAKIHRSEPSLGPTALRSPSKSCPNST